MDRLSPSDMAWFLAKFQGTAADMPPHAARHLAHLGLLSAENADAPITDAGFAWLAENGHAHVAAANDAWAARIDDDPRAAG